MAPTPTVENYLKAILQAQIPLSEAELVPMGDLARPSASQWGRRRMDEVLGRPAVDPHGDSISGREGSLEFHEKEGRRVTVGMDAAAKLLVDVVVALLFLFISVAPIRAQAPTATPFAILDNSFIVEEAFNQPVGVFQNIFGVRLDEGSEWAFGFTQEWPIASQTHQFSYTVPVAGPGGLIGSAGIGDVLINYRYQWWLERAGRPAFSPRLSIILPSGSEDEGRGAGVVGWQVNLPFSKQQGDLYFHWNGGFTWLPNVSRSPGVDDLPDGHDVDLFTPHLAASAIWRTRPMFHLMLEALAEFEEAAGATAATVRESLLTVSPGFRTGWNVSDHQIILGFAVPMTFAEDANNAAAFVYFSYELPFRR